MLIPPLIRCLADMTCVGLIVVSVFSAGTDHAAAQSQRSTRKNIYVAERPRRNDSEPYDTSPPDSDTVGDEVYRSKATYPRNPTTGDTSAGDLPIGAERTAAREGARLFQKAVREGRVHLLNLSRETMQLDGLSDVGLYHWPALPVRTPRPYLENPGDAPDGPPDFQNAPERSIPAPATRRKSAFTVVRPAASGLSDRRGQDASSLALYPVASGTTAANDSRTDGTLTDPVTAPPVEFFLMLNRLANSSTVRKPLVISSLLRPPYRTSAFPQAGPSNPHSLGLAADITEFGGHRIRSEDPEACVLAFIALLHALPAGRYRIGVPRAPESLTPLPQPADVDPDSGMSYPETPNENSGRTLPEVSRSLPGRGSRSTLRVPSKSRAYGQYAAARPGSGFDDLPRGAQTAEPVPQDVAWPFFPPARQIADVNGGIVTKYANERYAPMSDLNDSRVREALDLARVRGVNVFAMFPDGANHIHVDVKKIP